MVKHCLLWLALTATGLAQTLQLESALVTRNDTLKGTLVLNSPLSGQGQLTLTWTDSYGRTVAVESRTVTLNDRSVPFELRLKPAVALFNFLSVGLTSGQSTVKAGPAEFVVTPNEPWDDYQVIMYYAYKPEQQAALYDVRRGQYLGRKSEWAGTLDDKEPVILSALPQPVKGISVQAPACAKGGDLVTVAASTGRAAAWRCPRLSSTDRGCGWPGTHDAHS
jgi:hypothetical protein